MRVAELRATALSHGAGACTHSSLRSGGRVHRLAMPLSLHPGASVLQACPVHPGAALGRRLGELDSGRSKPLVFLEEVIKAQRGQVTRPQWFSWTVAFLATVKALAPFSNPISVVWDPDLALLL